jgi:hypothetical protein
MHPKVRRLARALTASFRRASPDLYRLIALAKESSAGVARAPGRSIGKPWHKPTIHSGADMRRLYLAFGTALALAACASTTVTPLAPNQLLIQTSTDLPCGDASTKKIATEMAAVETLRRGFDRFAVKPTKTEDTMYTYAQTNALKTAKAINADPIGRSIMQASISDAYDESLIVSMFRPGDAGYKMATDARTVLGPKWQKAVANGKASCTGVF